MTVFDSTFPREQLINLVKNSSLGRVSLMNSWEEYI